MGAFVQVDFFLHFNLPDKHITFVNQAIDNKMLFPDSDIMAMLAAGATDNKPVVTPEAIALPAGFSTRFYLLLVLHVSLKRVFKKAKRLQIPERETATPDIFGFRTFVNKLGHICDSAKDGEKITAFAVLQFGTIRYYFTSNHRDEEDYQRTSHYVAGILRTLGAVDDDQVRSEDGPDYSHLPVFSQLLRTIIEFNQSRIKGYIWEILGKIEHCIESTQQDLSNQGTSTPKYKVHDVELFATFV
jgi:hypothetical protein